MTLAFENDAAQRAREHFYVGQRHLRGHERDYQKARISFELVADQEVNEDIRIWAYIRLALLYYLEQGVEKNEELMISYVEKACGLARLRKGYDEILNIAEIVSDRAFNVHQKDENGDEPLHRALSRGYNVLGEVLIASGADIHGLNNNHSTPLNEALLKYVYWYRQSVVVSRNDIIEVLLMHGSDVTLLSDDALRVVFERGDTIVAELLLTKGFNVNAFLRHSLNFEYTPLHLAAKSCHVKMVTLLLDQGAEVNKKGFLKRTPLHEAAAANDSQEIVEMLLARGAEVNARNAAHETPLHIAVTGNDGVIQDCHIAVVKVLLTYGARVDVCDNKGKTPQRQALECQNLKMYLAFIPHSFYLPKDTIQKLSIFGTMRAKVDDVFSLLGLQKSSQSMVLARSKKSLSQRIGAILVCLWRNGVPKDLCYNIFLKDVAIRREVLAVLFQRIRDSLENNNCLVDQMVCLPLALRELVIASIYDCTMSVLRHISCERIRGGHWYSPEIPIQLSPDCLEEYFGNQILNNLRVRLGFIKR